MLALTHSVYEEEVCKPIKQSQPAVSSKEKVIGVIVSARCPGAELHISNFSEKNAAEYGFVLGPLRSTGSLLSQLNHHNIFGIKKALCIFFS